MAIDWSIVAPIATSLIGAAIGAALNHVFERRPRLISYIGHVASHLSQLDLVIKLPHYRVL